MEGVRIPPPPEMPRGSVEGVRTPGISGGGGVRTPLPDPPGISGGGGIRMPSIDPPGISGVHTPSTDPPGIFKRGRICTPSIDPPGIYGGGGVRTPAATDPPGGAGIRMPSIDPPHLGNPPNLPGFPSLEEVLKSNHYNWYSVLEFAEDKVSSDCPELAEHLSQFYEVVSKSVIW